MLHRRRKEAWAGASPSLVDPDYISRIHNSQAPRTHHIHCSFILESKFIVVNVGGDGRSLYATPLR